MKSNKTALLIILSVIVFSLILYFVPLGDLLGRLPLINRFYNNTTLEIIVQKGKAKIWINGEDYGETPATIEHLPEGKYLVELEKIADEDTFYQKLSFQLELTKNTAARIDLEIGPNDILNGAILYYTPAKSTKDEGFLTVTSNAEDAKVYIDKEFIKKAPMTNVTLRDNQYQAKITATGYDTIEIPIFIRTGYQLNLKTYHFPIPVVFDTLEEANE